MADTNYDVGIPEFYKGRTVFLTGFTGFLGKLIVEKLLYSCPEINKIYVLIRNKKNEHTTQGRFEEVLKSRAFLRLREKYPGALESKVIPIFGDLYSDRLGLSCEHEELIRNEVSVIIHGAASVRFDDPFKVAIQVNTLGAKKMVDLALTMPKLESLTYISTAYTNCDQLHIKEEIYPPKADWRKTLEICKKVDPAIIEILHQKYLNGMPNTYTYSKALAEWVFNDHRDRLPIVVVRPAIVAPSHKEPVCGWIDNKYGPVGLVVGSLLGLIRCSWVDVTQKCNYVMSDVAVNSIIAASWKAAMDHRNADAVPDSVKVYNICSPDHFNMNHEEFQYLYKQEKTLRMVNNDGINFETVQFYPKEWMFRLNNLYMHVLPAYLVDLIMVLNKKKPMLMSVRRKIFGAALSLSYFTTRTFTFDSDNFDEMLNSLNAQDRNEFGWEFVKSEYKNIYHESYGVIKQTILKPVFDDLDTNRRRLRMLYFVDQSSSYLTYSLMAFIIYHFSIIQFIISSISSFFILK